MTIYFLFGKTGSGKSYIGGLLEKLNIIHIDGDKHITPRMLDCLIEDEQMTSEMIDEFVNVLINVIKTQKEKTPQQSFVISQAMYLDKNRLKLLNAIPELKFVMIDVAPKLRESFITSRFQNKESKVSPRYAKEMDKFFDSPSHEVILLKNSQESDEILIEQIQEKMSALFDIVVKEELNSSMQLQFI
ncbi:zeta toxin family protein [Legionella maioricensis]|uniref:Zeta toxin family protein n=1 Tax=Legionella maioricensis TaxID=2896528 RepID=A0A9X2D358_9GAMM|nr:zeta toxin family protein [Legionella maioricensis]MCL9685631.1 zeta toxin family protein [Legionella maioricensis]MCL9689040.1 zeta toxin family protein [Legionella maioricensis]